MSKKIKQKFISGLCQITCLFSVVFLVFLPQPARADVWGAAMGAQIFALTVEKIQRQIEGFILGSLKTAAVQLLNQSIEQLVGGVNGSGLLFISDWEQYLEKVPAQQNQLFVNDFLSQTTRGKCSGINFESVARGKFNSNYFTYLCNQAQATVYSGSPIVNIDQYSANPTQALREGDWRVFNALFSNPANNPFGYSLMVQEAQQRDLAARMERARTEAVANQGYNSLRMGGIVVTPGRTVADLVASVKTLGNSLITGADNPAELVSGVIASVANRAMNQLLQRGFEVARSTIQREVGRVNQQISQTANQVNQVLGPAGQFVNGVNQQLGDINSTRNRSGGAPPSCAAGYPLAGC